MSTKMDTSVTSAGAGKLDNRIGFVGGGQMALALAKGFMASGLVSPSQVMASAPSDNNLALWRQLGAVTTNDNADIILSCDVIFLAVKPHIFPEVVAALEIDSIREPTEADAAGVEAAAGESEAAAAAADNTEVASVADSSKPPPVISDTTARYAYRCSQCYEQSSYAYYPQNDNCGLEALRVCDGRHHDQVPDAGAEQHHPGAACDPRPPQHAGHGGMRMRRLFPRRG